MSTIIGLDGQPINRPDPPKPEESRQKAEPVGTQIQEGDDFVAAVYWNKKGQNLTLRYYNLIANLCEQMVKKGFITRKGLLNSLKRDI